VVAEARTADKRLKVEDFVRVLRGRVRVEFSHKRLEVIFNECEGATVGPFELWTRVAKVLEDLVHDK
jgi:hypothetical protein